jgi:hypothetical protein
MITFTIEIEVRLIQITSKIACVVKDRASFLLMFNCHVASYRSCGLICLIMNYAYVPYALMVHSHEYAKFIPFFLQSRPWIFESL